MHYTTNKRSRNHFIQLADSIVEICLTLNKDLRVTCWGKKPGKLTGFSPEKAIGKQVARTNYKHLEKIYELNIYDLGQYLSALSLKCEEMELNMMKEESPALEDIMSMHNMCISAQR